jgi:hypothetical protein
MAWCNARKWATMTVVCVARSCAAMCVPISRDGSDSDPGRAPAGRERLIDRSPISPPRVACSGSAARGTRAAHWRIEYACIALHAWRGPGLVNESWMDGSVGVSRYRRDVGSLWRWDFVLSRIDAHQGRGRGRDGRPAAKDHHHTGSLAAAVAHATWCWLMMSSAHHTFTPVPDRSIYRRLAAASSLLVIRLSSLKHHLVDLMPRGAIDCLRQNWCAHRDGKI